MSSVIEFGRTGYSWRVGIPRDHGDVWIRSPVLFLHCKQYRTRRGGLASRDSVPFESGLYFVDILRVFGGV